MNRNNIDLLISDSRFNKAMHHFNSADWYLAHDYFEELWHESVDPERQTLQGLLQISVAQLHLEKGNKNGATILFGEGLGRLRKIGSPDLGLNLKKLCKSVEARLSVLQHNGNLDLFELPFLEKK